jgi:hypothetical protein
LAYQLNNPFRGDLSSLLLEWWIFLGHWIIGPHSLLPPPDMVLIRRRLWAPFQVKLGKRFISNVITEEGSGTPTNRVPDYSPAG